MLLGQLERFVERLLAGVDGTVLERGARDQQVRFERLVGRLVDDLQGPLAGLLLVLARRDLGETDLRRRVLRVELERFLEQPDRLVVLMRRDEQLAPARAQRGDLPRAP